MPQSSKLRQFATPQNNSCGLCTAIDNVGRFLLPLDKVFYQLLTDEGRPILIPGRIVQITFKLVTVEPEPGIRFRFGLGNSVLPGMYVVRTPADLNTERQFISVMTTYNRRMVERYGPLHLNGEKIYA